MKHTIDSYEVAMRRIETYGFLADVGQISKSVIEQLYRGQKLGDIKVSYDSWPIRGCGPKSGEWVKYFERARPVIIDITPNNSRYLLT